ncbi:MAG TPA: hypothetical protein VF950_11180 [Planctomycetota bacterium]
MAILAGCGKTPAGTSTSLKPIAASVVLTVRSDLATSFYAALWRDGGEAVFQIAPVKAGEPAKIAWREAVDRPREWKLKFGPSKHPTYTLAILPDRGATPVIGLKDRDGLHDPKNALAIAYFAVPFDGERALEIELKKPAPFVAEVKDVDGRPLAGAPLLGVATPRYLFLDGFDPASVDETRVTWSWDFTHFDTVPTFKGNRERLAHAKTGADGKAVLEGFIGWVGLSEKTAPFSRPRSVLAMPDRRAASFVAVLDPAKVRLTAQGLPGRDHFITQRGLLAEGEWAGGRWEEPVRFVAGDVVEFLTPCRDVRLRPVSEVHALKAGGTIDGLKPGETRRHKAVLEEVEHLTIEGEVRLDDLDKGREYCGIDLHGPSGALLQSAGPRGSQGVPPTGRIPFLFHVAKEGPYTIVVKTGRYPWAVVPDVKAPREGLSIRLSPDKKNISCAINLPGGFVVGAWPHRDLLSSFASGGDALGKPGLNTFVVFTETGSAVLRDVALVEGAAPTLAPALTPGTTVTGRVVDVEGRPAARRWVHLSWPGYLKMPHAYRFLADLTGEDGRFEIPRVPAGPWRLYERETGTRIGEPFTIPEGSGAWDAGTRVKP